MVHSIHFSGVNTVSVIERAETFITHPDLGKGENKEIFAKEEKKSLTRLKVPAQIQAIPSPAIAYSDGFSKNACAARISDSMSPWRSTNFCNFS